MRFAFFIAAMMIIPLCKGCQGDDACAQAPAKPTAPITHPGPPGHDHCPLPDNCPQPVDCCNDHDDGYCHWTDDCCRNRCSTCSRCRCSLLQRLRDRRACRRYCCRRDDCCSDSGRRVRGCRRCDCGCPDCTCDRCAGPCPCQCFDCTCQRIGIKPIGRGLRYQMYRDATADWRWRLKAANNRTVADSGEGYQTRGGALDGISLCQSSDYAPIETVLPFIEELPVPSK